MKQDQHMRRYISRSSFLLLILVAFSVQGCLGMGGGGNTPSGQNVTTNSSGQQVNVNQNAFKGKIYVTIDQNLYVFNGDGSHTVLANGGNIIDPAVSPDGKWVVFVRRYKNYDDLAYVSTSGGAVHLLRTGNGRFWVDSGFVHNNFYWYAQPRWSADGSHLIFLSDLQKNYVWASLGQPFNNSPFLDMQVFSMPFNNPSSPQVIAYASFGDGGDRDPSYQPGSTQPPQIVYTHYMYDSTGTQQVIQLFLEDATAIPNHPYSYTPEKDAGVALTPPNTENLEPTFSPDGKSLAYIRRESPTQMGLYIMPVAQGVTTDPNDPAMAKKALLPYNSSAHIQSGQYISQPVWSPDGTAIAYLGYDNNSFDLWMANVSQNAKTGAYTLQGSPTQLITGIDGVSRPVWTK